MNETQESSSDRQTHKNIISRKFNIPPDPDVQKILEDLYMTKIILFALLGCVVGLMAHILFMR